MAHNDRQTQLIELTSHLAQQIQRKIQPDISHLSHLAQIYRCNDVESNILRALIKSLDVPYLERCLRRISPTTTITSPPSVPGRRVTLYKAPLPVEAQARVAADSLIARYLSWLARNPRRRALALVESDRHVVLFVPEGSKFDPEEAWREFVAFVSSGEELVRTFIAMLNSIQLSARSFGVPEFPILSEDQQLVMLAWFLRSVQSVEKRLRGREMRMTNLEASLNGLSDKEREKIQKDIRDLHHNQDKELKKYGENFNRRFSGYLRDQQEAFRLIHECKSSLSSEGLKPAQLKMFQNKLNKSQLKLELTQDQLLESEQFLSRANSDPLEFMKQFADQHPQIFKRVYMLTEYFTERAARQINLTTGPNFANIMVEIVRLTNWLESRSSNVIQAIRAQKLKLRPLLFEAPEMLLKRSPGDGTGEFCYVCGELLALEDKAQVSRFVFRSPSQRLQSVRGEQRPPVCRHCVALAFVSPLKPSDQSVIVRLDLTGQDNRRSGRSAAMLGILESFLRGLTLSQLDLAAGNYLMLTSSERIKVGNKWRSLSAVVGTVIYAHLRLAGLFDHQIFAEYKARIATGLSDIELEPHRLAFLSILIKSLQLHLTEGSEVNRSLTSATRYTLADEPILANYELIRRPNIDPKRRQEKVHIEIEKSLEVWTKMIAPKSRAKLIEDVVAMAGLLSPFVDRARQEVRKENNPSLDADREASKLIEEVDEPFNFLYRFADNTARSTARLYRNPTNWFTYEQTKALLEKLGVDLGERENIENGARFLEVNANDVEAAYKEFAEGDYKADRDWRAFTYRLKLALYCRFAELA